MKEPLDIALHFLKFRPRTVFEIRRKLESKKIEQEEIEKVLVVLKHNKLLDDAEFAKMYVRDRNLLKPTGSYLLRLELKKLGLSENDIENAMIDQDAAQNQETLARQLLESKSKYRDADFNKQAQFLARHGFSTSTIYKILK